MMHYLITSFVIRFNRHAQMRVSDLGLTNQIAQKPSPSMNFEFVTVPTFCRDVNKSFVLHSFLITNQSPTPF